MRKCFFLLFSYILSPIHTGVIEAFGNLLISEVSVANLISNFFTTLILYIILSFKGIDHMTDNTKGFCVFNP